MLSNIFYYLLGPYLVSVLVTSYSNFLCWIFLISPNNISKDGPWKSSSKYSLPYTRSWLVESMEHYLS